MVGLLTHEYNKRFILQQKIYLTKQEEISREQQQEISHKPQDKLLKFDHNQVKKTTTKNTHKNKQNKTKQKTKTKQLSFYKI